MKPFSLSWWVQNNYQQIKTIVQGKAFKFHLEFGEMMHEVNYKICVAIDNGAFDNTEIKSKFLGWIHVVVHNTAINMYRIKKNRPIVDSDDALLLADNCSANQVLQEGDIDMENLASDVVSSIKKRVRSERDWGVFVACFIEGRKYEEMAEMFDIPVGTIKTIIFKLRKLAAKTHQKAYDKLMTG